MILSIVEMSDSQPRINVHESLINYNAITNIVIISQGTTKVNRIGTAAHYHSKISK